MNVRNPFIHSVYFSKPCISASGSACAARQEVAIKQGIDAETAKRMVKTLKTSKLKVQAQVQGEKVRVTGKKRDDLQKVIATLKDTDFDVPLQFDNFRD